MTAVDNRVVQMEFDNKKFSQNVDNTVKDLNTLENKMQFQNAGAGFQKIQQASGNVNFSGIQQGIEAINNKLSLMGVVAFNVASRITDAFMNVGQQIAYSVSLEAVVAGYGEYETKLNSIQTILANTQSKGTNLTDVTNALNELNTYADQTIYNFAEMTRNIGTFTAAGVDLDVSTNAIKGIANLAAVSGSSSLQASTAMYQLSQALATGKVQLMDWNSVVNAGMGGEVFQESLKATARIAGVAIDDIIAKNGSFRDSLQEGWLTAEILTDTLNKFTLTTSDMNKELLISQGYTSEQADEIMRMGDMAQSAATEVKTFTQLIDTTKEALGSGWAQTWELVIGDIDEAKELWTSISNVLSTVVNDTSNARNELAQAWADMGGREKTIEALSNILGTLGDLLGTIGDAFKEVFPAITAQNLRDITNDFLAFSKTVKIEQTTLNKLKDVFKGLFTVVLTVSDVIRGALSAAFTVFSTVAGYVQTVFSALLNLVTGGETTFSEFAQGLRDSTGTFTTFMSSITNLLPTVEEFAAGIQYVRDTIAGFIGDGGLITTIITGIGDAFSYLADVAGQAVDTISGFLTNLDWNKVFLGGAAVAGGWTLITVIQKIKEIFGSVGDISEAFVGALEGVGDTLGAFQEQMQAGTILKIAVSIGVLALALGLLAQIDPIALAAGAAAMGVLMGELIGLTAALRALPVTGLGPTAIGLIGLSVALLILSAAVSKLAQLDSNALTTGTTALGVLMIQMTAMSAMMSKFSGPTLRGAVSLIVIGAALHIFAGAIEKLGSIDVNTSVQGIITMATVLGIMIGVLKLAQSSVGGAISMVIIGASLLIFAEALEKFGTLPFETLQQGGIAIGVMLIALIGALYLMKSAIGGAIAMLIISGALLSLALAVGIFGAMPLDTLVQGLGALVVILVLFVGVSLLLAPVALQILLVSAAFVIFATGLMIAAAAIVVMSIGLVMLSAVGYPVLGFLALLALALVPLMILSPLMFIFGAGLLFMGVGLIAAGAGLILVSIAGPIAAGALAGLAGAALLLGIATPFLILAGIGLIALGVGALLAGVGLVVFSLACTLLNASLPTTLPLLSQLGDTVMTLAPSAAALAVLGVSLILFGAGALVAGAGLLVLAAGMALFAAIGARGTDALVQFGEKVPEFVVASVAILAAVPGWLAAGAALLVLGAGALVAAAGILLLGTGLLTFNVGLLMFTNSYPRAEQGFLSLVPVMMMLAPVAPILISVGIAMMQLGVGMMMLIAGMATATSLTNAYSTAMTTMGISTASTAAMMPSYFAAMQEGVTSGLLATTEAVIGGSSDIQSALLTLAKNVPVYIAALAVQFNAMGPMVYRAISSARPQAELAGRYVVHGAINGMGSMMSSVYNKGYEIGQRAIAGLNDGAGNASPSKLAMLSGAYIGEGTIIGMHRYANKVYSEGQALGASAISGLNANKYNNGLFEDLDANPTITPVVDLSYFDAALATMQRDMNMVIETRGSFAGTPTDYRQSQVINNTYIVDGLTLNDLQNNADYTIQQLWTMTNRLGRA